MSCCLFLSHACISPLLLLFLSLFRIMLCCHPPSLPRLRQGPQLPWRPQREGLFPLRAGARPHSALPNSGEGTWKRERGHWEGYEDQYRQTHTLMTDDAQVFRELGARLLDARKEEYEDTYAARSPPLALSVRLPVIKTCVSFPAACLLTAGAGS